MKLLSHLFTFTLFPLDTAATTTPVATWEEANAWTAADVHRDAEDKRDTSRNGREAVGTSGRDARQVEMMPSCTSRVVRTGMHSAAVIIEVPKRPRHEGAWSCLHEENYSTRFCFVLS